MTEPTFSETTERLYSRLPQVYQDEDVANDYAFKRWLSGMVDQLGQIDTYVDRFTFYKTGVDPSLGQSDLADPYKADVAWLPWIAQMVGAQLDPRAPVGSQRDTIASAILGIKPGSKDAIALAAKPALVGDQYVKVYDHSTDLLHLNNQTQWDVLLVTRASETLENRMNVLQATMAAQGGWTPTSYRVNYVGAATWTLGTATTHTTGTTNPLRGSSYNTYGGGTAYIQGGCNANTPMKGSLFIRGAGGGGTLSLVYLNASNTVISQTDLAVTGTAAWSRKRWSGTTPANTATIRLQVNVTAGTLDVSFPFAGPDDDVLFDSSSAGVTIEGGNVKQGQVNYCNNSSYDVNSGWYSPASISLTTSRFWVNNSSALLNTQTVVPYIQPVVATEVFEGETVKSKVRVQQEINGNGCYLLFYYTLANGTNTQTTGTAQLLNGTDWTEITLTDVAPAQAKSMTVALYFNSQYYYNFYVDGWQITKGPHDFDYGDGDMAGWSWTNPAAIDSSISYASLTNTDAVIMRDTNVLNSNVIDVTAQVDGVVRFEQNVSFGYMVISASDPFSFMMSAYAMQTGTYEGVLQVRFTKDDGTVTGTFETEMTLNSSVQQWSMASVTAPALSTRAFLRFYVFGTNKDDHFRFTMAGGRLGSVTTWIAQTADPVGQVIRAGAKPAGILLHQANFDAAWSTIEADRPDWNSGTASNSWEPNNWTQIEETGL